VRTGRAAARSTPWRDGANGADTPMLAGC